MIAAALLLCSMSPDVDKAALRKTITLPMVELNFGFDLENLGAVLATAELQAVNLKLLDKPKDPDLLFAAADAARRAGVDAADSLFGQARDGYAALPARAPAQTASLAICLAELKDFDKARAAIQGASDTSPEVLLARSRIETLSWGPEMQLGGLYGFLGQLVGQEKEELDRCKDKVTKSLELADKAVQLEPKGAKANFAAGELRLALAFLNFAVAQNAGDESKKLDTADALKFLEQAAKLKPESLEYEAACVVATLVMDPDGFGTPSKRSSDRLKAADAKFQAMAASTGPSQLPAAEFAAISAAWQGENERAASLGTKLLALSPDSDRLMTLNLDLLLLAEHYEPAIDAAKKLLAKERTPALALKLARAYDGAGKAELARGTVVDALLAFPDSGLLLLAKSALDLRDPSGEGLNEARTNLDLLARVASPDWESTSDLRFLRAVVFALIGDVSESRRLLENLLKANPNQKKYRAALNALGTAAHFGPLVRLKK